MIQGHCNLNQMRLLLYQDFVKPKGPPGERSESNEPAAATPEQATSEPTSEMLTSNTVVVVLSCHRPRRNPVKLVVRCTAGATEVQHNVFFFFFFYYIK